MVPTAFDAEGLGALVAYDPEGQRDVNAAGDDRGGRAGPWPAR